MRISILFLLSIFFYLNVNAQVIHIKEDFNSSIRPIGWTTNALSGSSTWSFGIDGSGVDMGNNNLDGTPMAYFDDDFFGGTSTNNTTGLTTPSFDNSSYTRTLLEFDYNFRQFNAPQDSFYVEVFDGTNWQTVFSRDVDDCGRWTSPTCMNNGFPHASIDISTHANANCQVRFVYFDGNDWAWYVGVDNVTISSNPSFDLSVSEVIAPVSGCQLDTNETLEVVVVNFGTDTVHNFKIAYDVNNGTSIYEDTVTITLFPFDTIHYIFSSGVDLSDPDSSVLKVYTTLGLDTNYANDTLRTTFINDTSFLVAFFDDFEGINHWKVEGVNPSWELGVPMNTFIDSAFSGMNAYVTNLDGRYNSSERSYLVSPCFDLRGVTRPPIISFQMKHSTELGFDSLKLEYTVDRAKTWIKLEEEKIPINWYSKGNNWEGNSINWIKVENSLTSLIGERFVQFRFVLETDGGVNGEGIAIDDFRIREIDSTEITPINVVYPTSLRANTCGLSNERIEIAVQNSGIKPVDSVFLFYQINGGIVFNDTLVSTIAPFSRFNYVFKDQYNFTNVGSYSIVVWSQTPGDTASFNDTLRYTLQNTQSFTGYSLPYLETFDPPNFEAGTINFNVNDSLGNGWNRRGTYSWRIADGTLYRTKNTGPNFDYNGNGSLFAYAESNLGLVGDSAILESPCIDLSGVDSATLSFRYHRYGDSNMAPFYVDVFDGLEWSLLTQVSDNPQTSGTDAWAYHSVNLNDYARRKIKIRFRTYKQGCCRQSMAIDHVSIFETVSTDLILAEVQFPKDNCSMVDSVEVMVQNKGLQHIVGSIPIAYSINGGGVQNASISLATPLAPDSSIALTVHQLNLSSRIENKVKVWVNLTTDQNTLNDTIQFSVPVKEQMANLYSEDFDLFIDGLCGTLGVSLNDYLGDVLQNGWIEKSLGNFRWNVQNGAICGGTTTIASGPSNDHTSGQGNFMFTEASGISSIDTAILESPCIDYSSTTTAGMSFWYHRYGTAMGAFYMDVFANGVWHLALDSLIGQSQTSSLDPWLFKNVQFNQFAGQVIKIRFRVIYGGGFEGDMGIDDIEFYNPIQQDARLVRLNLQQTSCINDSAQVELHINNNGLDTIAPNTLKFYYQLNGNTAQLIDSNSTAIAIDSNITYTTVISNLYGIGINFLTVWVELMNDSNTFNDTLHYDLNLLHVAPDYIEGFEGLVSQAAQCGNLNPSLNLSWEIEPGDQWVLGNDVLCSYNGSATPAVSSGPDNAYLGNGFIYFEPGFNTVKDTAVLHSTCIDLGNDTNATLEFYYHTYGAGMGKLYIDGRSSSGNWLRLDSLVGQNHFSGADAWSLRAIPLNQFSGEVIRLRFMAIESGNSSISSQGNIALDDIRVHNALLTSVPKVVSEKNSILVFPNPTKGECTIQLHAQYRGNRYQVFDHRGSRIKEGRILNERTTIDLSGYSKGIYYLKVDEISEVKKMIVY